MESNGRLSCTAMGMKQEAISESISRLCSVYYLEYKKCIPEQDFFRSHMHVPVGPLRVLPYALDWALITYF
jgi:hypothetical protein